MKPSNVMFTNGELDPWRTEGLQADTRINPEALNRKTTTVVPKCNEPPPGNDVFGIVYPGQVHVSDLSRKARNATDSPVNIGLALFGKALDAWLPCFEARNKDKLATF